MPFLPRLIASVVLCSSLVAPNASLTAQAHG